MHPHHCISVPMAGRYESEGKMKVCLGAFAILYPLQWSQNVFVLRPEKPWSEHKRKHSLFPTEECTLFNCPLSIFSTRNSFIATNKILNFYWDMLTFLRKNSPEEDLDSHIDTIQAFSFLYLLRISQTWRKHTTGEERDIDFHLFFLLFFLLSLFV